MAKLKIVTIPNPILKERAKKVEKIDNEIQQLVKDMINYLKTGPEGKRVGVGLAAPQIGRSLRIIVIWSKRSRQILPMINPEIIWESKRTKLGVQESRNPLEGCLSVPEFWGLVRRFTKIKVKYTTPKNQTITRRFSGFTSVVVQHEIDHLNGILFVDRIKEQKGKLYKVAKDEKGKEMLVEAKY